MSAVQQQVSRALAAPVETAREFVRDQAVNHVDETGWREQSKLNWLWVNATEQVTAFQIAPKRDAATAREVIGRARTSIITTDRYLRLQLVGDSQTASLLGASQARLPGYLGTFRRVARDR
jgi:transposase-like protein